MLLNIYIGALIFGGVLLVASILLGGHGDVDADIDGDLELGVEGPDVDVDAATDVATVSGKDFDPGDAGDLLFFLKSPRFYIFFAAFFGLTGVVFHVLELAPEMVTLFVSIAMGLVSGYGASWVMRALFRTAGGGDKPIAYIGTTVRVLVPVSSESAGKVRLHVDGRSIDLLASTDEAAFEKGDEAMIIGMDGPRARIARFRD